MKKIICIVIFIVSEFIPVNLYAMDEENKIETVISFELTVEDRFGYEVRVSDGGCLYDGSQKITTGTMIYQLSVGEKKTFLIQPDKGYRIKEITINGQIVANDINKIEITGVSANCVLDITYAKMEGSSNIPVGPEEKEEDIQDKKEELADKSTETKNSNINKIIPSTGDLLTGGKYICLMLIVLYRFCISKTGINTKCVDNKAILNNVAKIKQIEIMKEEERNER